MPKILIIDDDEDFSYLTKTALVQKGYDTAISQTVSKAVEEIRQKRPDLILMDIMMPEITGADAVRMFRDDPGLRNIPIIFLTGLVAKAEEEIEESGIDVDGVIYPTLGKPYDINKLIRVVRKNLVKPDA